MLAAAVQAAYNTQAGAELLVTPINPAGNSFYVYVSQFQPLDLSTAGIYDITPTANITLKVRAWGGAGGGGVGGAGATTNNANSGGGGYAEGDFAFVANNTYRVVVGSPGVTGSGNTGGAAGAFGSPGAGSNGNGGTFPQGGGSGGGFTGLFSSTTVNQANALVVAGGGGGGGGVTNDAADTVWNGTAGGSTTTVQNTSHNTLGLVVTAPTTSAAGSNASGMTGANGGAGNFQGRGGGGGGYWGGGAFQGVSPDWGGVGGTGGISFINGLVTNAFSAQGGLVSTSAYTAGRTPGLADEAFRSTSGNGAQFSANGLPGRFMLVAPVDARDKYENSVSLYLPLNGTDGSTTFTDVRGNTVTRRNNLCTISTAQSVSGGSSLFLNNNDGLVVPYSTVLDLTTGDFTIEFWFRTSTNTAILPLVGQFNTTNVTSPTDLQYLIRFQNANLNFGVYIGGVQTLITATGGPWNDDNWHHAALVRSGSTFTAFVDGVSRGTASNAGAMQNNGGWGTRIGTYREGGVDYHATGYLDEVKITKGVARYTASFTPAFELPITGRDSHAANVSVLLLMNGQNGSTTFTDVKGNTVTRTVGGTGSLTQSNVAWRFGGAAALFSGADANATNIAGLQIPDGTAVQLGGGINFTVEAWINVTSLAERRTIFGKFAGGATERIIWQIGTNGAISFTVQNSAGTVLFQPVSAAGAIVVGNWYHIALVRNGTTITIYVNGQSVASGTYNDAVNLNIAGTPFSIGRYFNATTGFLDNFAGYMDSFRITKNVARYTANFIPPAAEFPRG